MVWTTIHDADRDEVAKSCVPPQQLMAARTHNFLQHNSELDFRSSAAMIRLSGIVCTIGPSSRDPEILEQLMDRGMNIARLNFSHGSHEYHAESIRNIRTAVESYSKKMGMSYPLAIALDMKGPEIRTGFLEGGQSAEVELKRGDTIKLTPDKAYLEKGNTNIIYVDFDNIGKIVPVGNRIFIDHGLISLICSSIQGSIVVCTVEIGGILGGQKGVNLPGVDTELPAISYTDKEDLMFAVEQDVDMIFVSYVQNAVTIAEIRDILGADGKRILVISKIGTQEGILNSDEIIKVSDGIMVARGHLGIEIPTEKVFIAQKCLMSKCNEVGKPVICAAHMLDSMTTKPKPTRAEGSDVANAVIDGADCVMLSGETAKGRYPLECVSTMSKLCKEAESVIWHRRHFRDLVNKLVPPLEPTQTIAIAAVQASYKCLATAIIVLSTSGRSAYLISKFRPRCPIICVTRNAQVARQAHLYRGVIPLIFQNEKRDVFFEDKEERFTFGMNFGKWKRFIKSGDAVILVCGSRRGSGYTDTMKIMYVMKPEPETCGCD